MNKNIFIILLAFIISFVGLIASSAHAQNTQNFSINKFDAFYELSKSNKNISQMNVNEYILASFPDFDQNHGILRALPQVYNKADLKLQINKVDTSTGPQDTQPRAWTYTKSTQNDNLILKIGSANNFVHGQQLYHIGYSVQNVVNKYTDHDELYWNVNGTQWQQTIESEVATVTLAKDIASSYIKAICYTGVYKSTASNCQITESTDNNIKKIKITASNKLLPSENLSFALWFNPNTFEVAKPSHTFAYIFAAICLASLLLPIIVFTAMLNKWRKYGRDPKGRGTIVAQYEPPEDSSLVINDFVLNEHHRNISITAQLIDLAIKGYLMIIDSSPDASKDKNHKFSLQLLKSTEGLSSEQIEVLKMFFDDNLQINKNVNIDDLKNKLNSKTATLAKNTAVLATDGGYFASNPAKIKNRYIGWGIACIILAFIGFFTLILIPVSAGLIITAIVLFIGAKIMPARSIKGVELHDYMLGLKLYIGMAEQERIKFHQSPSSAERKRINLTDNRQMIKLFEALLPYAMLFDMEKQWGKQFESLYISPPDWYSGNWTAFNAGYLAGSLNSFNTASATSFTSPSSSGSSGFSGGG
ncbi:MAG: DUF2207 domain-containing protein, partial [Candidatus Saccharibacteria bacterium]